MTKTLIQKFIFLTDNFEKQKASNFIIEKHSSEYHLIFEITTDKTITPVKNTLKIMESYNEIIKYL